MRRGFNWLTADIAELPKWVVGCFAVFIASVVAQISGLVPERYELLGFLIGFVPMFPAAGYIAYLRLSDISRTGNNG